MISIFNDDSLQEVNEIDYIFVLGKEAGWNNKPDYVLEKRLAITKNLFDNHQKAKVVCSGGKGFANKSNFEGSEAQMMMNYLNDVGVNGNYIELEDRSVGGINQLVIIKKEYVIKRHPKTIAIVSDEFHIQYVSAVFDAINGDECKVYYIGAKINISGKYRETIQDYFETRRLNQEIFTSLYKRGDHEAFERHEKGYRELMKLRIDRGESRLQMIEPNDVLEFIKTGIDPKFKTL